MADNLSIKGVESDQPAPGHGRKPKGKRRKPFAIETRTQHNKPDPNSVFFTLKLYDWYVHSRYETRARRDQAFAALVKKAENDFMHVKYGIKTEYRKVDPDV